MKPCKFKVGDKVIRINGGFHENPMTIKEIEYNNVHRCWYLGFEFNDNLNYTRCVWEERYYELVEESKDHPHKDLIIDWANGAEIEWFNDLLKKWIPTKSPAWSETIKYRIKPQVNTITVKYKTGLFKLDNGEYYTESCNDDPKFYEADPEFVKWISDWTECKIEINY